MNECLSKALFCTPISVNSRLVEIFSSSQSQISSVQDEQVPNGLRKTKMDHPKRNIPKTIKGNARSPIKGTAIIVDSLTEISPDLKPRNGSDSGNSEISNGEQKSTSSSNWQCTTGLASFQTLDSIGLPEVED
eukprot:Seg688.6 transcript_id=Seg688.6/GoldUCD/mRNA.D3Y31 product="hypothetical protein" protein_id=Seg688.6/GoldUCD/D3Y31